MDELITLLKLNKMTIGSCESLTAGLFSATLASVSGASAVLKGGLVTYHSHLKHKLAHVDMDLIEKYGVISMECARSMAMKSREVLEVDICVSFTGNAGPSTMEGKEAGLVYCCIAGPYGVKDCVYHYSYPRNELRQHVVLDMIDEVKTYILSKNRGIDNGKK